MIEIPDGARFVRQAVEFGEMGSGKTAGAVDAAKRLGDTCRSVVVVCPKTVIGIFVQTIELDDPGSRVAVNDAWTGMGRGRKWLVVSPDYIEGEGVLDKLMEDSYDLLVVDEMHWRGRRKSLLKLRSSVARCFPV